MNQQKKHQADTISQTPVPSANVSQSPAALAMKRLHCASVLICTLLFVAFSNSAGCSNATVEPPTAETVSKQAAKSNGKSVGKVDLIIDLDDPEKVPTKLIGLKLKHGATIAEVMKDSSLKFESKGKGATAFLESIAGIQNEGAGKRNWMYYVNEERADKSFGKYQLKDGDTVVWKFNKYEN